MEAPEVGVSLFDGANFIAYGTEDPLATLEVLYPCVVGVHLKDCAPPLAPGFLSRPVPMGPGAARVDEPIDLLLDVGFAGPLILETYDNVNPLQTLEEARTDVLDRLRRRSGRSSPMKQVDE